MGWIIFGCILALFAALFSISLVITVHYTDEFQVWVGACGWNYGLLLSKEEQQLRNAKKKKKTDPQQKKASGKRKPSGKRAVHQPEKQPEKGNLKETVQIVFDLLRSVCKPIPYLLRHFRITGLDARITVGGEDAAEAAIAYGRICAVLHGSLAALKNMIRVQIRRVDISCDFCSGETRQDIRFKLKIRFGVLIWTALRMGGLFLCHTVQRMARKNGAESIPQPAGGKKPPLK